MAETIKKLTALALAGLMLLSCAACGDDKEEESGTSPEDMAVSALGQVVEEKKAADKVFSVNYDPEADDRIAHNGQSFGITWNCLVVTIPYNLYLQTADLGILHGCRSLQAG